MPPRMLHEKKFSELSRAFGRAKKKMIFQKIYINEQERGGSSSFPPLKDIKMIFYILLLLHFAIREFKPWHNC